MTHSDTEFSDFRIDSAISLIVFDDKDVNFWQFHLLGEKVKTYKRMAWGVQEGCRPLALRAGHP
jgi:hypothetical protein